MTDFLPYLFLFYDSNHNVVGWHVYVPDDGDELDDVKNQARAICFFLGHSSVAIFNSKVPGESSCLFIAELIVDV